MPEPPRVLFVTRRFPPSIGGMQVFAHQLYGALSRTNRTVRVSWGGSNRALPLVLPVMFVRAAWALLRRKVDLIHMQDGLLAPMGFVLSKVFKRPFVVIIHGLDVTYPPAIYQLVVPWCLRRAAAVVCISGAAAEEVRRRGVPAERVHVIPVGAEDRIGNDAATGALRSALDLEDGTEVLLSVGRLVRRKGIAWFSRHVLPDLVKRHPRLMYVVIGDGEQAEAIAAAASEAGVADHLVLLGRTSAALRDAAYRDADVFVMPNIPVDGDIEGFGLVLLEAALCELPVVASDLEGIKDAIVSGRNGVLVAVQRSDEFLDGISKFLAAPEAARDFGRRSRLFTLAHYQWNTIAERYNAVYASATGS